MFSAGENGCLIKQHVIGWLTRLPDQTACYWLVNLGFLIA
jgi:hypothetical protein